MGECVNLTVRGRKCRNRATYTVHHVQGYTSGHCARHYQYWYGGLWQYRTDIVSVETTLREARRAFTRERGER